MVYPCGLQDGTDADDYTKNVVVGDDGSIVLSGYTEGDWNGLNAGEADFSAVKLDSNGAELWRWQVRLDRFSLSLRNFCRMVSWLPMGSRESPHCRQFWSFWNIFSR